jgi:hypothetical protein
MGVPRSKPLPVFVSDHVGIFPTMSEFFPIPVLYAGKNPLLVDGRDPGLSHAENPEGGSKNIPLTAEGIIRRM